MSFVFVKCFLFLLALFPFPNKTAEVTDVRSVMPFKVHNETYLAVANYNPSYKNGFNIFKITFEERPVPKLDPTVPEIISTLLDKMAMELSQVKLFTVIHLLKSVLEWVIQKKMVRITCHDYPSCKSRRSRKEKWFKIKRI